MDLSRRASRPASLPESRRSSDFFRPVTAAAYTTPIPLVIGQQRVQTTVIRDGRVAGPGTDAAIDNVIRYGLCEGPIQSMRKQYADQGLQTDLGLVGSTAAHFATALPWVGVTETDADASIKSISIEVSTEISLAGATSSYVASGVDAGLTAAGQPQRFTDCHACTTGVGSEASQYMVVWSYTNQALVLYSRTVGGSWSLVSTLVSASVNSSLLPASGALVQPRVAAVGELVHVVWSRLDNAAEPVQICHAWSTDGGTTWTLGASLVPMTKVSAVGVQKLGISLHSSGEVWICFQKRNATSTPRAAYNTTKGLCVGFLPSTATASTAWIQPDTTSNVYAPGLQGELCLVDGSWQTYPGNIATYMEMTRDPSVVALGGGEAWISCVFMPPNQAQRCSLLVLPVKADTLVRWDLPEEAFVLGTSDTDPHDNVANIAWLAANGYMGAPLGWLPSYSIDSYNEGSTQLVCYADGAFAVLVNAAPMYMPPTGYDMKGSIGRPEAARTPDYAPDRVTWGAWSLYVGTLGDALAWTQTVAITTTTAPGFAATLFWNGTEFFVATGVPATWAEGARFWEAWSVAEVALWKITTAWRLTQVFDFFPSTAPMNSVTYQFWAQNGEVVATWREDEDGLLTATNGVRVVDITPTIGDVLPSVMCKRLLTGDRLRGLDIQWLQFDDENGPNAGSSTWEAFDSYCRAMGLYFSLALTSQQAAWPLVCDILESANAVPFRSQGLLKVYVRETATITGNGYTYTPRPEHAASCAAIPAARLKPGEGLKVVLLESDQNWNRLTVSWKNRTRAYADDCTVVQDEGDVSRRGVIDASSCDWPWIVTSQRALTCAWLRLRHQRRTGRTYSFSVDQRYMLLEPGDIVTVNDGQIPARTVRITRASEAVGSWITMEAEDVVVASTAIAPPGAASGGSEPTVSVASPVNLPIIFVALIGGLLQVWCLLSGGAGWRGCTVQQSWDGTAWQTVGSCSTPSPTGHLVQAMDRLRVRPGLRVHPGLRVGVADFAVGDYSESAALPPWPSWGDYLAGNPGALLWVDGELLSYAVESDDGERLAQCSVLLRGLYGTTVGPHPILARVGAVTDAAFRWPVPAGGTGRTCYWRFPCLGEDPAAVRVYSVEIPA